MRNRWIRMAAVVVVTAVLMSIGSLAAYALVAQPQYYAQYMENGQTYLDAGAYQEAILEYNKAITIEAKSTEARVGAGKSYVGNGQTEEAVAVLREAQALELQNTALLQEIIAILKDVAPEDAYEILQGYVDYVGEGHIAAEMAPMIASAREDPVLPALRPAPGAYAAPVQLQLVSDKIRIGHVFYYATGNKKLGSDDTRYAGPIPITESCTVRVQSVNTMGVKTEVLSVEYIIDETVAPRLRSLVETARTTYEATEVGIEVGNCVEGAKEALLPFLEQAESIVADLDAEAPVLLESAQQALAALTAALEDFQLHIIVATDRAALQTAIDTSTSLLSSATEGDREGQYHRGAKQELQAANDAAATVLVDLLARQDAVDSATSALTAAITRFQNQKVTAQEARFIQILDSIGASSGPVTVSLLWNSSDDLDLHVTSPQGDTVYFGNRYSSSGGQLDVDRQVSSFVDHPVENIYWNNPPAGTYTVNLDVFTKRSSGNISYSIRVLVNGEAKVYDGTISSGSKHICTFSY